MGWACRAAMMTPPLNSVQGEGTMCRLTVESASGSLTVVTSNREGENERKTNNVPRNGSSWNCCRHTQAKESIPLRKSTGSQATNTFS